MKTIDMSKMTAPQFIRTLHAALESAPDTTAGEIKLACWYWLHAQPLSKEALEAMDAMSAELVASTKEDYSDLAIELADNPELVETVSEDDLPDVLASIRLNGERIKRSDPSWLPSPQEVDQYSTQEEKLKARRARLLERIQELEDHLHWCPDDHLANRTVRDLQDELAAVESALGWPEPKEPEEADGIPIDVPPMTDEEMEALHLQEAKDAAPEWCPTCLCLYEHEDPMQSCQCGS